MKIFLDDKRKINPKYQYNCVYTFEECILLIDIFKSNLDFISLDYDLGVSSYTGFDVLVYMAKNGVKPKHINIHSDHHEGVPKMRNYAEEHFLNTNITTNKIQSYCSFDKKHVNFTFKDEF